MKIVESHFLYNNQNHNTNHSIQTLMTKQSWRHEQFFFFHALIFIE